MEIIVGYILKRCVFVRKIFVVGITKLDYT